MRDTFSIENALLRALCLQADNGFRLVSEPHSKQSFEKMFEHSSCATKKGHRFGVLRGAGRGISPLEFCKTIEKSFCLCLAKFFGHR